MWDGKFLGAGCRNRDFSRAALFHEPTYSSTRACWVHPSPRHPSAPRVAVWMRKAPRLAMRAEPLSQDAPAQHPDLGAGLGPLVKEHTDANTQLSRRNLF